jgi:D-amino-acid dehydrogenase
MSQRYDVLVIGAGIVGTSVGAELARRGSKVCLIDKNQIGKGCSYGNAGWMTPCFAMPLPMPGMLVKSMKWLLDPASPLYIKPSASLDLARWLFEFLKAMNEKQARRSVENLVILSQKSLQEYEKLSETYPEIRFEKKGLLMVSQTSDGVRAAQEELDYVSKYGVSGRMLSADGIKELEPALTKSLRGGVFFENEAMAEPYLVVQAQAEEIRKNGGEIFENCEFQEMEFTSGKVDKIKTSQGEFIADSVVVATGSWTKQLAHYLQLRIPILGGKGYAMILPPLKIQPRHPIMLIEKKIAITPRESSLRIAGTLELVDQDFSITHRRVENIKSGAREILDLPDQLQVQELWAGLRPCTPDGVPLIGFHKSIKNLVIAAGHQMLGLQSGAGTGLMVADLIEGKPAFVDSQIFNPNRF